MMMVLHQGAVPVHPIVVPAHPIVVPARPIVVPARPIVVPAHPIVVPARPIVVPAHPIVVPVFLLVLACPVVGAPDLGHDHPAVVEHPAHLIPVHLFSVHPTPADRDVAASVAIPYFLAYLSNPTSFANQVTK